jgi:hypothetical protein
MPLWINEGLSDHMTGYWRPVDLMMVRDAAISDIVPPMSQLTNYGNLSIPRMIYNLGHAAFEFIESRGGKKVLQDYIVALRKSVIGGGGDAFEEAFELENQEFDRQFEQYLKDRFKPFRDKERPADFGRNLAPDTERTRYSNALSVEPSPSGELLAIVTGNSRDQEADIVLVSARDGREIVNMTNGFDQGMGFEFIVTPGGRWNTVPWLTWSPSGDRLAYFVRNEKSRTLVLQDVLTREVAERFEMRTVDDPESPDFSPDGRRVAFAALRQGVGDIFVLDLDTGDVTNVTDDAFADSGPTWSPDGQSIVYVGRVSGNEKLFRLDLATGAKTQLTFGTHDDASAQFLDADTLVFASTAVDPAEPIEPEVARDGNIYNIWTLSLKDGRLRQFTDALGGTFSTSVLKDETGASRIAFISYDKTEWGLHVLDRREPIATALAADFGGPTEIDFQPPLSHTLVEDNVREKGTFENMFMDGRPPVNLGVTSGGDIFGGSALTVSDVLGDQQFSFYAASVSRYRTMSLSYTNLSRRLNWAVQGYSQTTFFYGQYDGVLYDPIYSGLIDRDLAQATSTIQGGTIYAFWPLDRYRRLELFGSAANYRQQFNDPVLDFLSQDYQEQQFGRRLLQNGWFLPVGVSFIQETTIFREFGPLSGNTMRIAFESSPSVGAALGRQTLDVDLRKYARIGASGLLALRARGFRSWGESPDFMYYGGNSEMRGYEYLEFLGSDAAFLNAELRFPLIEAMLTPLGVMGGIRGVLFTNFGGGAFEGRSQDPARQGGKFKAFSSGSEQYTPILGVQDVFDPVTQRFERVLVPGEPVTVDGFRLVDARASYGIGLQTFALGFPVNFDWSWKTLFNKEWEDVLFAGRGGSERFRRPKFSLWIGYDF